MDFHGDELIYFLMAVIPSSLLIVLMLLGGIDLDFGFDIGMGDFQLFSDAGPLGLKALLAFVAGFGLGGFLSESEGWAGGSIVWGFIFAFLLYIGVILFMRIIYGQRSNTLKLDSNLIGQSCTVTTPIAKGKPGEISTIDSMTGSTVHLTARCFRPLAPGSKVHITQVQGGTAYVE